MLVLVCSPYSSQMEVWVVAKCEMLQVFADKILASDCESNVKPTILRSSTCPGRSAPKASSLVMHKPRRLFHLHGSSCLFRRYGDI